MATSGTDTTNQLFGGSVTSVENTGADNLFQVASVTSVTGVGGRYSTGHSDNITVSEAVSLAVAIAFYDSASVFDIIGTPILAANVTAGDTVAAQDLIGVADGLTYAIIKIFSDSVSALESLETLKAAGIPDPGDSSSATDVLAFAISKALTDSALAFETLALTSSKPFTDSSSTTDVPLLGFTKSVTGDSASVTESLLYAIGKVFTDAASVADLVSVPDGLTYTFNKTTSDNATASESFARSVTYDRVFTGDSSVALETSILSLSKILKADSAQASESSVFAVGKTLADSTNTTTESSVFAVGKTLADSTNTTTESLSKDLNIYLLREGDFTLELALVQYDSNGQEFDVFTRQVNYNRSYADSIQATESIVVSKGFNIFFADSATSGDSVHPFARGTEFTVDPDAVLVTDSDGIIISPNPVASDTTTEIADTTTLLVSFNRAFADSVAPTESLIWDWTYNLPSDSAQPTESIALNFSLAAPFGAAKDELDEATDLFTRIVAYSRGFTDAVTAEFTVIIGDGVEYQMTKQITDQVTVTESLALGGQSDITDSSSAVDTPVLSIGVVARGDSSSTADSAYAFMQDYFLEEYVAHSQRYVEKAYYSSI